MYQIGGGTQYHPYKTLFLNVPFLPHNPGKEVQTLRRGGWRTMRPEWLYSGRGDGIKSINIQCVLYASLLRDLKGYGSPVADWLCMSREEAELLQLSYLKESMHAILKPQWLGAESCAARVCTLEDNGISAQPIVLVDRP